MQCIRVNSSNSRFLFLYAPCVPWLNPTLAVLFLSILSILWFLKYLAVLRAALFCVFCGFKAFKISGFIHFPSLYWPLATCHFPLERSSFSVVSIPLKSFKIKVSRSFHFSLFLLFLFVFFVYSVVSKPIKPFKIKVSSTFGVLFFCGFSICLRYFSLFSGSFLWF